MNMEPGQRRVLGAQRSAAEAVSSADQTEDTRRLIAKITGGSKEDRSVQELERALCYFTNNNSSYTNIDSDDFQALLEEVLNNHIRSILVYADFSTAFGDEEVYALSMAFQYNLSVEALTLSGINVSDESISALCEALVRARVNFIDLSNTPLEDEAGRSLAALARVNPYLRTVVVDDTLISGDLLDEIDVACQYNQSNYEASGNALDEVMLKEADLGRLKQRLRQAVRAQHLRTRYCVLHLFGLCSFGSTCVFSHNLSGSGVDESTGSLSDKIGKLFRTGGNWEERLLQPPLEGAAWRGTDDGAEHAEVELNVGKRQEIKRRLEEEKKKRRRNRRSAAARRGGLAPHAYLAAGLVVGVAAAAALVGFALYVRRHR